MKTSTQNLPLVLALLMVCSSASALAQEKCHYQPAFATLQQQLPTMPAPEASKALQKYFVEHENAQACELTQIERLLDGKEIELIKLSSGNTTLKPHSFFHCNQFNPKTAQCQSPMEDGTAHPMQANLAFKPLPTPAATMRLTSDLPGAKLIGIYQTTLAAALDGKPAKPLPLGDTIKWKAGRSGGVLIAIYKTTGPWAYRKSVWYFQ